MFTSDQIVFYKYYIISVMKSEERANNYEPIILSTRFMDKMVAPANSDKEIPEADDSHLFYEHIIPSAT